MVERISDILVDISKYFESNPSDLNALASFLKTKIHEIYSNFTKFHKGYCSKFPIPTVKISDTIAKYTNIDDKRLQSAFLNEWGLALEKSYNMYGNSFYHYLLILILYASKINHEELFNTCLQLILFRIWNGRLTKAIKYCDPDTMEYVVTKMTSAKHLVRRFSDPYHLITGYFVPTLRKTYMERLKNNNDMLKRLFNQCYSRVHQIFYQNYRKDLLTGENKAVSGLAPLYYKAKEESRSVIKASLLPKDEEEVRDFSTGMTTSGIDELVDMVLNSMIMAAYPKYDESIIGRISRESLLKDAGIQKLIEKIHSPKYEAYLKDALVLFLSLIPMKQKSVICSNRFYNLVKSYVISTKHHQKINDYRRILDILLTNILSEYNVDYNSYSSVRKAHFRTALTYLLAYNIQKQLCSEEG